VRVVIIGNAGSGKSTLARRLADGRVPVLELDLVVWDPDAIAVARPPELARADLERFCGGHESWIVEGCYGDLAERALAWRPELVFLDPGEDVCLANCRARPWEPRKFASPQAQDAFLEPLLAWVSAYYTRDDDLSLARHRALFDAYDGPKRCLTSYPT
jgi:adenylate kinase family enzyme